MQRIVVGVDGSTRSHRALQWAVDEARVRKADLNVVHAWSVAYAAAYPFAPFVDPSVYEQSAKDALEAAVNAVDTHGVHLQTTLVCGGAADSLITAAKDADLLVVGSRGVGGFSALLLGSVSHQVSHHAPCPVVIVPSTD